MAAAAAEEAVEFEASARSQEPALARTLLALVWEGCRTVAV